MKPKQYAKAIAAAFTGAASFAVGAAADNVIDLRDTVGIIAAAITAGVAIYLIPNGAPDA